MAKVDINGVLYEPRSLTLREFRKVQAVEDQTDGDALALSLACGISLEEATVWFDSVTVTVALAAVQAMRDAALKDGAAQFPVATPDDESPVLA